MLHALGMSSASSTSTKHRDGKAHLRELARIVNASEFRVDKVTEGPAAELRTLALNGSPIAFDDVRSIRHLGEGAFARVDLCELSADARARIAKSGEEPPRELVAVKMAKTHMIAEPHPQAPGERRIVPMPAHESVNFLAEAVLLKAINHECVVRYHGAFAYPSADGSNEPERFAIVQEFAEGGTLKERIEMRDYNPADGLRWLHDVARALAHLHSAECGHVAHRDMKPENILLTSDGRAKLADYSLFRIQPPERWADGGSSNRRGAPVLALGAAPQGYDDEDVPEGAPPFTVSHSFANHTSWMAPRSIRHAIVTGRTGSVRYMAPENWKNLPYSHRVDTFSFGVLAWEVLSQSRAYADLYFTGEQVAQHVAISGLRPHLPRSWPEDLRDLLEGCWQDDARARPEMSVVVDGIASVRASAERDPSVLSGIRQGFRVPSCCPRPNTGKQT